MALPGKITEKKKGIAGLVDKVTQVVTNVVGGTTDKVTQLTTPVPSNSQTPFTTVTTSTPSQPSNKIITTDTKTGTTTTTDTKTGTTTTTPPKPKSPIIGSGNKTPIAIQTINPNTGEVKVTVTSGGTGSKIISQETLRQSSNEYGKGRLGSAQKYLEQKYGYGSEESKGFITRGKNILRRNKQLEKTPPKVGEDKLQYQERLLRSEGIDTSKGFIIEGDYAYLKTEESQTNKQRLETQETVLDYNVPKFINPFYIDEYKEDTKKYIPKQEFIIGQSKTTKEPKLITEYKESDIKRIGLRNFSFEEQTQGFKELNPGTFEKAPLSYSIGLRDPSGLVKGYQQTKAVARETGGLYSLGITVVEEGATGLVGGAAFKGGVAILKPIVKVGGKLIPNVVKYGSKPFKVLSRLGGSKAVSTSITVGTPVAVGLYEGTYASIRDTGSVDFERGLSSGAKTGLFIGGASIGEKIINKLSLKGEQIGTKLASNIEKNPTFKELQQELPFKDALTGKQFKGTPVKLQKYSGKYQGTFGNKIGSIGGRNVKQRTGVITLTERSKRSRGLARNPNISYDKNIQIIRNENKIIRSGYANINNKIQPVIQVTENKRLGDVGRIQKKTSYVGSNREVTLSIVPKGTSTTIGYKLRKPSSQISTSRISESQYKDISVGLKQEQKTQLLNFNKQKSSKGFTKEQPQLSYTSNRNINTPELLEQQKETSKITPIQKQQTVKGFRQGQKEKIIERIKQKQIEQKQLRFKQLTEQRYNYNNVPNVSNQFNNLEKATIKQENYLPSVNVKRKDMILSKPTKKDIDMYVDFNGKSITQSNNIIQSEQQQISKALDSNNIIDVIETNKGTFKTISNLKPLERSKIFTYYKINEDYSLTSKDALKLYAGIKNLQTNKQISAILPKQKQNIIEQLKQKTQQIQRQSYVQSQKQLLKYKIDTKQEYIKPNKLKQLTDNITQKEKFKPLEEKIIETKKPKLRPPKLRIKQNKLIQLKTTENKPKQFKNLQTKGFDVVIKRYGKEIKVGENLPIGKAQRVLSEKLKFTLGASGKLKQSGYTNIKDIDFNISKKEFREYKIVKGKKVSTPLSFIQKTRKEGGLISGRLGTREEVFEIQSKKLKGGLI